MRHALVRFGWLASIHKEDICITLQLPKVGNVHAKTIALIYIHKYDVSQKLGYLDLSE
jgi:hypothetical protein